MQLCPVLLIFVAATCAGGQTISFEPPRWFGLDPPEWPGSGCIAAGDFNGDSRADLAGLNASGTEIAMTIGNGDGTLQSPLRVPTPYAAVAEAIARDPCLIAADLNQDGRIDLVTSNGGRTLLVLFGNGDATFRAPVELSAPVHLNVVRAADFNRDGNLDLIAATMFTPGVPAPALEPSGIVIFLGAHDSTFAPPHVVSSVAVAATLAIGDLNADGNPDLVGSAGYEPALSVWLGRGDGTFNERLHHDAPGVVYAIADADLDGNPDILSSSPSAILVFPGNGDGTFRRPVRTTVDSFLYAIRVADIDADGRPDVVISGSDAVSVLLGKGDGEFSGAKPLGARSGPIRSEQLELVDLNGDAIVDLAYSDLEGMTVHFGTRNGGFQQTSSYGGGKRLLRFWSGDWNGDGRTDLAALGSGGSLWFFSGDGTGDFRLVEELALEAPNVLAVIAADLTSDGRTDLLVSRRWEDSLRPNNLDLYVSGGGFRFAPPQRLMSRERPWASISASDVNGDGKTDLIVSPNGLYVSVLLGSGDGTFSDSMCTPVFFSLFAGIADLNNDGLPDLLDQDFSSSARLLLGRGDGTFEQPLVLSGLSFYSGVEAIDVDGDGADDLLTANGVFRGTGRGEFDQVSEFSLGNFCDESFDLYFFCDVDPADFNGDRVSDVLAIPEIWAGDGNGDFAHAAAIPPPDGNRWTTHIIVDVNADGKPDIVAGDGSHRFAVFVNRSGR
jgi:hypothetical protein